MTNDADEGLVREDLQTFLYTVPPPWNSFSFFRPWVALVLLPSKYREGDPYCLNPYTLKESWQIRPTVLKQRSFCSGQDPIVSVDKTFHTIQSVFWLLSTCWVIQRISVLRVVTVRNRNIFTTFVGETYFSCDEVVLLPSLLSSWQYSKDGT